MRATGTMQINLNNILPFTLPHRITDKANYLAYKEWDKAARQIQISAISGLTALLYIVFNLLNKSWASEQTQLLMLKIHLFAIIPILLTISFLAYKKRFYHIVLPLLTLFPAVSISSHMYIVSKLSNYAPFLTEGYLGVLWIFIVSGMTFKNALVSAAIATLILLISGFYIINDTDIYTMHVFWIFCSFSFGFLGAFLFDSSRKATFISEQTLQKIAITDELTGLNNRTHFNKVINQELARSKRYQKSFGLLLIDIDHFKKINDTYGHTTGDNVLKKVASVLASLTRKNDTLIRWGGEEFVVIAIEVNENSLNDICEKLRTEISTNLYSPVNKITISIGATLATPNDDRDTLLTRADKALYQAKEQGRNTSVFIK